MSHDDGELLRAYAKGHDERCFAEVVRRHVDLVYSAALRRVGGDAHRAQEVTQMIFTDLARKAGALANHPALGAWLHQSTRFAAAKLVRGEVRRKAREEVFATQVEIDRDASAEWRGVEAVLDAALDELGESDRRAVVLRFFEGASYAEVATSLGVGENGAQMRTSRALEKLRRALARRGVVSTASALGMALTGNAVAAAPVEVASGAVAVAQAGAATGAGAGAVVTEAISIMSTSKVVSGVVAAAVLLGAGVGFVGGRAVSSVGTTTAEPSVSETAKTAGERDAAALRAAREENTRLAGEVAKLRARLEEQAKALEEQGARLAKFDAATKAQDQRRVFKDLNELGKFTAEVSLRALAMVKRYNGKPPKPDSPEFAKMMEEYGKLSEDAALLLQDPMFIEEMQSHDPGRMTALQLAYIGEMLGFTETQKATFRTAIEAGYREAFAKGVQWAPKHAELERINNTAVAQVKATLTPAQMEVFKEAKFERILFNFTVGGGP